MESIEQRTLPFDLLPNVRLQINFMISSEVIEHERSVYTFMDLIGDLGGVHDLIVFFVSFFMGSISEYSFIIKAMNLLYQVKTAEIGIFVHKIKSKKDKSPH